MGLADAAISPGTSPRTPTCAGLTDDVALSEDGSCGTGIGSGAGCKRASADDLPR